MSQMNATRRGLKALRAAMNTPKYIPAPGELFRSADETLHAVRSAELSLMALTPAYTRPPASETEEERGKRLPDDFEVLRQGYRNIKGHTRHTQALLHPLTVAMERIWGIALLVRRSDFICSVEREGRSLGQVWQPLPKYSIYE